MGILNFRRGGPACPPGIQGAHIGAPLHIIYMVFIALFLIGCDKPAKVDIGELVEALNGLDKDEVVDTDEINTDDDLLVCEEGEKRCESQWVMVCTGGEFVQSEHCVDCGPLCQCVESAGDAWCEHTDPGPDDGDVSDADLVEAEPDEDLVEGDLSAEAEAEADDIVVVDADLPDEPVDEDCCVEPVDDDVIVIPFSIDGLVAWWKLDGNGDDSIGNYDTFSGTGFTFFTDTRYSDETQSGNGWGNYSIDINPFLTDGFTISAWAKYTAISTSENAVLAWTDGVSSNDTNSIIIDAYSTRIRNDSSGTYAAWSHDDHIADAWYHYTVTLDATKFFTVYLNGVEVYSVDASVADYLPNFTAMNQFIIGGCYETPDHYSSEARIDDVMLFDRALSAQEIVLLYAHGLDGYSSDDNIVNVICTGQTKCYDNTGLITCPIEGVDFYGQDSQYALLGYCASRDYTVIGTIPEEIVIDNNTGLEWQRTLPTDYDDCGGNWCTWQQAMNYCDTLSYGGYSIGWRLPTAAELETLYGYGGSSIDTTAFPDAPAKMFWTMTPSLATADDAWYVNGTNGFVGTFSKSDNGFVARCIREGSLPSKMFVESTEGGKEIVTEITTGLVWTKEHSSTTLTWEAALNYCETLSYANYTDWRLPNIIELKTLVNRGVSSPASDFPGMSVSTFWSSSSLMGNVERAWGVIFSYGSMADETKSLPCYAICVR